MAKHISDIDLASANANSNALAANQKAGEQVQAKATPAHVEAINQLFTELELSYHNQFHKAFPDHQSLSMAKQLWLRMLAEYPAEFITHAGRKSICDNTFLPTLHSIREHCDAAATAGLPDCKAAYIEACIAKPGEHQWSHPIVYYAGKATDWFFLKGQIESQTYPVFQRNYEILKERIRRGEVLEMPLLKAIESQQVAPLETDEQKSRLALLRKQLDL